MANKDPLFGAALKEWLKYGLLVSGIGLFLMGLSCMPAALVNPEATTSVFVVFAAGGLVIRYGVVMMVIGALLFANSFLMRDDSK